MTRISQQQLESYLWGAATLLRGTIDAGDYKQFIFPLLFYKRLCDVYDEETRNALLESGGNEEFAAFPENHRFQIPQEAHWGEVRKVAKNVGVALQSAMRSIETANPDKLFGIFGDAQWTNKDRLPDSMLRDLIEHFSSLELSIENLPEDELGNGYEYLIKKFADDSGHTAAEFYTNRTVVHLMTELLQPESGESVYDPTCGSGGMLLSCVAHLRRQNKEWRNVRLFGQERNLMTSAIARMNCFLHGIEDFRIERGDTLAEPKFVQEDRLQQFDIVLANPPYSIKQWDREAFASDAWGRNMFGTPPQGRADYAFWQHIIKSMDSNSGRCAILFPHGVLFRQEEAEMRRKLVDADLIDCVIGLGPNLFYNSPMEACIVICRTEKPKHRRNRILFINAVNQVTRERARSFLTDEHIRRIINAYERFEDETGFTHVVPIKEIRSRGGVLSIPLYVTISLALSSGSHHQNIPLQSDIEDWMLSRVDVINALKNTISSVTPATIDGASNDCKECQLHKRSDWQRVHFGDIVENINDTCDPVNEGIERYIGLEHLKSGSLHINSWGSVSEGTTFTRRCRPGQILFGKRRAYQRKVAVAEFDAVVSGDIYVFAPKNDRLLPEFLPFICTCEQFFEYAVKTSAGSLSPRTNWSHLGNFEFNLPPLDQQRRIADILWAIYEVQVQCQKREDDGWALLNSMLDKYINSQPTNTYHLEDVFEVKHGWAFEGKYFNEIKNGPILLTPGNFSLKGELDFSEKNTKYYSGPFPDNYILSTGDLVLVMTDLTPDAKLLGMPAVVGTKQKLLHNQRIGKMQYDPTVLHPRFAYFLLLSDAVRRQIRKTASGSTVRHTSPSRILQVKANIPPYDEQVVLVQRFDAIMAIYRSCVENRILLSRLATSIREALLSKIRWDQT